MAESVESNALPNYRSPPVVEMILGVQFDRLALQNAHLGAFWRTLDREDWPKAADAPPIPTTFERFEPVQWARMIHLQLTQDPSCRAQFTNTAGSRMIQVQNSRLHYNWLGQAGGAYPRFEKMLSEFEGLNVSFATFLAEESLGAGTPNQWEITYVNHIPRGTVWNTPADWGFFRLLSGMITIPNVVVGESFGGEWHFLIPEKRGRLHVQWQHELSSKEAEKIVLTLTARGPIDGADQGWKSVVQGIGLGRETIVRFFRDSMSQNANAFWGLDHG